MSPSASKPTVLIVGGSGNTGFPVSLGLLESGQFNVILLCRSGTELNPRVIELQQKGAQIRSGDIVENSVEELETRVLEGIEILILMVSSFYIEIQEKILIAASKSKSVKRVVPSEFVPVHLNGEMARKSLVLNKHMKIRELVKQLELPYTYINVGWWVDLLLPRPGPSSEHDFIAERSHWFVGTGDVKTAVIARADIGQLVALVINDPRTLNQQVFGCGDEVSLNDIYKVSEKAGYMLSDRKEIITEEQLFKRLGEAQETYKLSPSHISLSMETMLVAHHLMFIDGENTIDVAKKLGYLDARDLYPGKFKPLNLEEFAKVFYENTASDGIVVPVK